MSSTTSVYRPELDGLRAVAVSLVVAFHAGFLGISGGFIGVDVFFVLSGYLISSQLLKELRSQGRLALSHFYARRIRRLLPASALTVLVTLLAAAWLLAPAELAATAQAARASSVYLANAFFAVNAADYFAADVKTNPLLHLWSLAVEEQFYFIWPMVLWAVLGPRATPRRTLITLVTIALASFALCVYLTAHSPSWGFFSPMSRAWEFAAGALAAEAPRPPPGSRRWATRLGWACLLALLYAAHAVREQAFPGWIALWPVIATALLLWSLRLPQLTGLSGLLSLRPLTRLGQLSYSWYLWHWPALVLTLALAPMCSVAVRAAAVAVALVIAAAVHRLVENPLRHHQTLARSPWRALWFAAGIALLTIAASEWTSIAASKRAAAPEMARISRAVLDIAQMDRKRCVSLRDDSTALRCDYGDLHSATRLVLFGDSHAIQWFDALESLARKKGWHLSTLLKSGCPAGDLAPPTLSSAAAAACQRWRVHAYAVLEQIHPSLVILSSATPFVGTAVPGLDWERAMQRSLNVIEHAGARALIIRDTPRPGFNVPSCLARAQAQGRDLQSTCSFQEQSALNTVAAGAERRALSIAASTTAGCGPRGCWVDMSPALCAEGTCTPIRNGQVVFRDDNHLTGHFAATLEGALASAVQAALP